MMRDFRFAILTLAFVLAALGGGAQPTRPSTPGGAEAQGAGEAEILPEEVLAPAVSSADGWGGDPPPWYEDPRSVDCGQREACRDSLDNKTAGDAN